MIGGLSWESSAEYYRLINEGVRERLGGLHSADCLLYSFDFAEIERLQAAGDWDGATARMVDAARRLARGGADLLLICSNTMHRMADEVQQSINVPLIHIADPTAAAIRAASIDTVALLGTIYTMEQDFYRGRLERNYGLRVLTPDVDARQTVNRVIYDELVCGEVKPESRAAYSDIISRLAAEGAQGVILGCTEIMLLIRPADSPIPTFDTTGLHAAAAVDAALA